MIRTAGRSRRERTHGDGASGHKTSSVFRRYDIMSADDLNAAAEKLDAALTRAAHKKERRSGEGPHFSRTERARRLKIR